MKTFFMLLCGYLAADIWLNEISTISLAFGGILTAITVVLAVAHFPVYRNYNDD